MCAFGNGHARRRDVAVDRAVVAEIDLFARGHVAGDLAEDHHGLREDLRLDPAVRPDGQDVLAELDLAYDVPLDRQILAAGQLTLDNDGFSDIHGTLLQSANLVAAAHRFRRG